MKKWHNPVKSPIVRAATDPNGIARRRRNRNSKEETK